LSRGIGEVLVKTKFITLLAVAIMLTGCGKSNEVNIDKPKTVTTEEQLTVAEDSFDIQKAKDDKIGNYTAFLNNEKKAKPDCDADMFEYEKKEEYDLEALKDIASCNSNGVEDSCDFDYKYIDCGCDGENELMICIRKDYITYIFVLKDVGGDLFIRYVAEDGDRSQTGISEDGYVTGTGKGGAELAIDEYGFLDKDVRYNLFFTRQYYLALDPGMAGIEDEEVLNNHQLLVYSFDMDYEADDEESMCELYDIRRDDDVVDPQIKDAFIGAGYKFYSKKEIKERLLKRADEIGLSNLNINEWKKDLEYFDE